MQKRIMNKKKEVAVKLPNARKELDNAERGRMSVVQSWGRHPSKFEEPPKEERIRRRGAI